MRFKDFSDNLQRFLFEVFSRRTLESGVLKDSRELIHLQIILLLISFLFAFILFHLKLYVLLTLPAIVAILPLLYLESAKSKRRSEIERELPFYLAYASIVQRSGVSLLESMLRLRRYDVFRTMKRESNLLTLSLGRTPNEVLKDYAEFNPNDDFKKIVESYLNVLKSGGDVATHLDDSLNILLERLRKRCEKFVETVALLSEVLVALFILLPLTVIIGSLAFAQYQTLIHVWLFILTIPLLTIVIYYAIDKIQPKIPSEEIFTRKDIIPITLGAFASYMLFNVLRFLFDFTTSLGLSLIVALVTPSVIYNIRMRDVRIQEESISQFLRDLTERIRIGSDMLSSLEEISRGAYKKEFLDVILKIKNVLALNSPVEFVTSLPWIKSWLFRYVMFMISELASLGALAVNPLVSLTRFMDEFFEIRSNLISSLKPYIFLFIITPTLIALPTMLMQAILIEQIEKTLFPLPGLSPAAIRMTVFLMQIMVLFISISLGILAAKMRNGTWINTTYACISLSVALITLIIGEKLIEFVLSFIGFNGYLTLITILICRIVLF